MAEVSKIKVPGGEIYDVRDRRVDEIQNEKAEVDSKLSQLESAVDTLNGEGEGSVKRAVTMGIADVVANAPQDFDTLVEIADWIEDHEEDAAAMNTAIKKANSRGYIKAVNVDDPSDVYEEGNIPTQNNLNLSGLISFLKESDGKYDVDISTATSITSLSNNLFEGISSLQSIRLPDSITSIGDSCFASCFNLVSIDVPKYLESIGTNAFRTCNMLKEFFMPDSIKYIKSGIFENCSSLKYVRLSESITEVPQNCFKGCGLLTSIHLPESLNTIGYGAFENCSFSVIYMTDNVEYISDNAFKNCVTLRSIRLSERLKRLSNNMFAGCAGLESIYIPDNVEDIGQYTFSDCVSLKYVSLPKSMQGFPRFSFDGCVNLQTIRIHKPYESLFGLDYFIPPNDDLKIIWDTDQNGYPTDENFAKITSMLTNGGEGKTITENSDLNDYLDIGTYKVSSAGISATIKNSPFTTNVFRLDVLASFVNKNLRIQVLYPLGLNVGKIYIRNRASGSSGYEWGKWYEYSGTPVD